MVSIYPEIGFIDKASHNLIYKAKSDRSLRAPKAGFVTRAFNEKKAGIFQAAITCKVEPAPFWV